VIRAPSLAAPKLLAAPKMKAMDTRCTGVVALVACLLSPPTLTGSIPDRGWAVHLPGLQLVPGMTAFDEGTN
jgi:hypothetical protein